MKEKGFLAIRTLVLVFVSLSVSGASHAGAEQPAMKRTILQTQDLSSPGREAVMASAEIPPNGIAARHAHSGEEFGYVLEGTLVLEKDGQGPVTLTQGDSYFIETGSVHGARNIGGTTVKLLGIFIVEKGKPLSSPAP